MTNHDPRLDRRQLLASLGALGAGAAVTGGTLAHAGEADLARDGAFDPESIAISGMCVLTAAQIQGPFFIDTGLLRKDITEGLPGLPLTVVLQIVRAADCAPVQDAVVELWHTEALGSYSGFASRGTLGQTFMRGAQVSGSGGRVCFETIYPGWYTGRTPHFHVKVFLGGLSVLTTQFYFRDFITEAVHTRFAPYDTVGLGTTTNATDNFFDQENLMNVVRHPNGTLGLLATKVIGVA